MIKLLPTHIVDLLKKVNSKIFRIIKRMIRLLQFKKNARQKLVDKIKNDGERVTHLYPNDTYIAHLSIYNFASQFTKGLRVLDAGSGSGYGSAYLAQVGAKYVTGIELSSAAVEFSREHFEKNNDNLEFKQMSLERINDFEDNSFDVIFSSNVLEHVPEVDAFFEETINLLQEQGMLILAVPPIQNNERHIGSIISNLNNAYHVNIWTMRQWKYLLGQYFYEIKQYTHKPTKENIYNSTNTPEQTQVTLNDFSFDQVIDDTVDVLPTMTAIFVATKPRKSTRAAKRSIIDHSFCVNLPSREITYNPQGILNTDILKTTGATVGPLSVGVIFCQTFISNRENLCGIALNIATYQKQIDSNLAFTLLDEKGDRVRTVEQNTKKIPDNSFFPFLFEPIPDSKDKKFTFCIETTETNGEFVTLWKNKNARNNCTKNDLPYDGCICFKRCYRD